MRCRHAKIVLAVRLCSENARLGVNQSNSKLKQQPPNPTCISFLLIKPVCFLMVLKSQRASDIEKHMHFRNAKIALALRLCSEIALPVVNTQHQHLTHERITPTGLPCFCYKTCVFLMVLKWQRPRDIEHACIAEIQKSLSPYACAAKSLFSAATSAKHSIGVNQKCL